ncbi:MAG: hypothetical protein ABIR54_16605 [Burkholderiaceae bacterium]|jgi:hypothetical protein
MGSKRTQDRTDCRVGTQAIAGTATGQQGLRRQKFELHSVLGEDGKVQVEVVWKSMDRAIGNQPIKTGVYAITQLAGEDRPSFIDRVDAFMCGLDAQG